MGAALSTTAPGSIGVVWTRAATTVRCPGLVDENSPDLRVSRSRLLRCCLCSNDEQEHSAREFPSASSHATHPIDLTVRCNGQAKYSVVVRRLRLCADAPIHLTPDFLYDHRRTTEAPLVVSFDPRPTARIASDTARPRGNLSTAGRLRSTQMGLTGAQAVSGGLSTSRKLKITSGGLNREYIIDIPANYYPTHPCSLTFPGTGRMVLRTEMRLASIPPITVPTSTRSTMPISSFSAKQPPVGHGAGTKADLPVSAMLA